LTSIRLKSKVICDDGYGRLNGRDGNADATPTGRYINNFDNTLAAKIRGAQQGFHHFSEEHTGKVVKVYSIDNTCEGIYSTSGTVPMDAVVHWAANCRGEIDPRMPLDYTIKSV